MLNEITKTNSQICNAIESVNNDLNIVKNLGKVNNQIKISEKEIEQISSLTDKNSIKIKQKNN